MKVNKKNKILVLNIPYGQQLTRRYMCTYVSPVSLFPPIELLSLASVCKNSGYEVVFKDAIADKGNLDDIVQLIKEINPFLIISLLGIDSFDYDIQFVDTVKKIFPKVIYLVFGHYPSIFSSEILEKSKVDGVIPGEPEVAINNLLRSFQNKDFNNSNNEIIFRDTIHHIAEAPNFRLKEIKSLQAPAYELINANSYYAPFLPKPFSTIQTARGCPYQCNYCVKSYGYGNKLTLRSAEQIVEEVEMLIELHQIKSFRFIDDTFTTNKKRVIQVCNLMIEKKLNLKWTCLSRTDNIDEELLTKMRTAGCVRIYFGIESGSQKMLDFYNKDIKVEEAMKSLLLTRKVGIETSGFFLLGLPNETDSDFKKSINFAIDSKLSMITIDGITLYPGTELFNLYKHEIHFSLFPYKNEFIDPNIRLTHTERKKLFYKKFYLRKNYMLKEGVNYMKNLPTFMSTFGRIVNNNWQEFRFMPRIHRTDESIS